MSHREPSKAAARVRPRELVADGPGQIWSWDITYLCSPIRGAFYYLYMFEDVWSRKIAGWEVHAEEEHLHSAIGFVTPQQRHEHADVKILQDRKRVYDAARRSNPKRWSGKVRNWERVERVWLNPESVKTPAEDIMAEAA